MSISCSPSPQSLPGLITVKTLLTACAQGAGTSKRFPIHPANAHRVRWGCDRYCPADDMACGNGADHTQHTEELVGPCWRARGVSARSRRPSLK